jgi:hypothetical protein
VYNVATKSVVQPQVQQNLQAHSPYYMSESPAQQQQRQQSSPYQNLQPVRPQQYQGHYAQVLQDSLKDK